MSLVEHLAGLLVAPVVDLSPLPAREFGERALQHLGARERGLPRGGQRVATEERDIDRKPCGHRPRTLAVIKVVKSERHEVALGLFERTNDDGRERVLLRGSKVRRFVQEDFASAVVLVVRAGERAATVEWLEPLTVNERDQGGTGVPPARRGKLKTGGGFLIIVNPPARKGFCPQQPNAGETVFAQPFPV